MYTAMESEIYGKDKVDESAHDLKLFNLYKDMSFKYGIAKVIIFSV